MTQRFPRWSFWACSALLFGSLAIVAVAVRAQLPWTVVPAVLALWSGHLSRRPARRLKRPALADIRSLVAGTAGMTLAVIAAAVAALPYVPRVL
jgi:predicted PurR-regulated permease PerM